MRLLARRDHSEQELANKLRQRQFGGEEIEAVITHCLAKEWLDDHKFSQQYIRRRGEQGYGPQRIYAELLQRGVEKSIINECLKFADIDWTSLLQSSFERRFAAVAAEPSERAKQMRFLLYRGYTHEQIQVVLRS
jgi:regulatory protein